jgi:hypothetical protein
MKTADVFAAAGSSVDGAQPGAMFGKPCFKLDGKAFVCLYQDCMVFKLGGADHAQALALSGSTLFDPSGSGRAMREWVQVSSQHGGRWRDLAAMAARYLRSGAATVGKPPPAKAASAPPTKAKARTAEAAPATTAVRARTPAPPATASKPTRSPAKARASSAGAKKR